MSTVRLNTVFLALGALVAGAVPMATRAQSGDALAHAEQTCLDHGVGPYSVTFDTCVARAAQAYDRAEPGVAEAEARRMADARQACLSYDIDPMTLGWHQCIAGENRHRSYASYVPDNHRY
jgi:hypothetical protein